MLHKSLGISFFLKTPRNKNVTLRTVYLRITIDGIPKETSTFKKWEMSRWNQSIGRAIGSKEDARTINLFLDSVLLKITSLQTKLSVDNVILTSQHLISHLKNKSQSQPTVLQEFQTHNEEMLALVDVGDYAKGTYDRYVTAKSHIEEYIKFKYKKDDFEFKDLKYSFVKGYEFFLKTERKCSNNTTLKYISNFKKIVLRAIAQEIIEKDPFKLFTGKKTKTNKRPLTVKELQKIENQKFKTERLSVVRDIFIFQCYTGLSYVDAKQLKYNKIKEESDGSLWIMSNRQKSKSQTDIPLLDKAITIMRRYKNHPLCQNSNLVLPVRSNQKMNEYLKEIAALCDIDSELNTHKARRTFASTVTLKNGVPINVVKELLGHHSVTQTEEYALTTQELINREMNTLKDKLKSNESEDFESIDLKKLLSENEINLLKEYQKLRSRILKFNEI